MNLTFIKIYSIVFLLLLMLPLQVFSQNQRMLDVALQYLQQNKEKLQLTETDISNYTLNDFYSSKHNGVTHIYLQQQHEGIPVSNAITNINILPNEEVLNMGNRFVSDLANKVNEIHPLVEPDAALKTVANKFVDATGLLPKIKERKNDHHYIFENSGIALNPINVRLMYALQEGGTVRLIWQVRLYQLDGQHMWNTQVDAMTGEILEYFDEVIHCDFNHTHDNCDLNINVKSSFEIEKIKAEDSKTHKTFLANYFAPVMGSTYNVFPMPIESPNHGDRMLVVDPADLEASPYGWHDTDGVDGAEYTITRGNNVHAYHDVFAQNASVGGEPDGGAMLEFDFPFEIDNDTVYQQLDAATVNLFYWNNIIHDFLYQYGFDEAAGNFQSNNYGNGGTENDYVRAEVTDGSGSNNANFFTPVDGERPRMQMFIWGGDNLPSTANFLDVYFVNGDTLEYEMRPAAFGGQLPEIPIVSPIVLVDDGVDNVHDACENIGNDNELVGNIALIDRGNCSLGESVLRAESEGATAVIVCQSETNQNLVSTMFPGALGDDVTIPAVMVSFFACNMLKSNIDDVIVSLGRPDTVTLPTPGPTGIDSDFDNGIIVHEYAHGLSNRLTGGPSASSCLRNREQAGEGWSDWFALAMTTTSANNADQGRGIGTYVFNQLPSGGGIRRFKYSRDFGVNPHTYVDINDDLTSVPHGVGSIWAVMIWDLYWNMVEVYGFDDDLVNGTGGNNLTIQLVLDGLKLQSCSPTFIDSRNAIIAADQANNGGANICLIWETFARRGLGFSAEPDGVEAFDIPLSCQFRLKLDKTAVLETDAGEVVTYSLEVKNDSPDSLTNVVIIDTLPAGVTLVDGSVSCANSTLSGVQLMIPLGGMAVGDSLVCTYQVMVDEAPFSYYLLNDGMENGIGEWIASSALGNELFQISTDNAYEGNNAWFAPNQAIESDLRLTTSNSYVLNDENASLSFWHIVNTEKSRDGGRVEISKDGGLTWEDLRNQFIQNGYTSLLQNDVIDGTHFGFSGDRGRYFQSIVDLSSFQGEEIMIRFRFTSDDNGNAEGWYIDNIQLFGNLHSIKNEACVSSDLEENICDEVTTVVFGVPEPVSNKNIDPSVGVSIFPNPSDGNIFVKIENNNNAATSLRLVGLDGRLLKQKDLDFSNGVIDFDVSEFPNGIYLLQVQTEDTQVVKKLILQE